MGELKKCFALSCQNTTALGVVLTIFSENDYEKIDFSEERGGEEFISELNDYGKAIFSALIRVKKTLSKERKKYGEADKKVICNLENKYSFLRYFLKDYIRSNYDPEFNFDILNIRNGYKIFGSFFPIDRMHSFICQTFEQQIPCE
ncbi:hypothetical protein EOL94_00585 [bacterium]|nr:hypothetical protein [bacterium]